VSTTGLSFLRTSVQHCSPKLVSAALLVGLALPAPGGIGLGDLQMGRRRRSLPRLDRMGRPLDRHAPSVPGRGFLRDRAARPGDALVAILTIR
jgi:hypothetical protein